MNGIGRLWCDIIKKEYSGHSEERSDVGIPIVLGEIATPVCGLVRNDRY